MLLEKRKKLLNYEWTYEISSLGKLRTIDRYVYNQNWPYMKLWKYIKTSIHPNWYEIVTLNKESKKKTYTIHRLVALNFIVRTDETSEVNHKNWIKTDNSVENLEWVTRSENNSHSFKVLWRINPMTWIKWEKHHWSKKIRQLTIDWEYIRERPCISMAAEHLWIKAGDISCVCRWYKIQRWKKYKSNHTKWYRWEFI